MHLSTPEAPAAAPTAPDDAADERTVVEAATAALALEEVHRRHGAEARIVGAEKVLRGGVAGFFQREVVQLTVDLDGVPAGVTRRALRPEDVHVPTVGRSFVAAVQQAMDADAAAGVDAGDETLLQLLDRAVGPQAPDGSLLGPSTPPVATTPPAAATAPAAPASPRTPAEGATDTLTRLALAEQAREQDATAELRTRTGVAQPAAPGPWSSTLDRTPDARVLPSRRTGAARPAAPLDDVLAAMAPTPTTPTTAVADAAPTPSTAAAPARSVAPVPALDPTTDAGAAACRRMAALVRGAPTGARPAAPARGADEVAAGTVDVDVDVDVAAGPWSRAGLLRLGLGSELVDRVAAHAPADDLAWLAAVTAVVTGLCTAPPEGRSVLVGGDAPLLAADADLDMVRPGERWPGRGDVVLDGLDDAATRRVLGTDPGARWVEVVVGDAAWRGWLWAAPGAVSWARPAALPVALATAAAHGLPLGRGPGRRGPVRPLDVALDLRAQLDAHVQGVAS